MKIHEYQAMEIFQKAGIPVSSGCVATELEEAQKIAEDIGFPVVLKAQILTGGRGKAGGIKIARNPEELKKSFALLKGMTIHGFKVERIFIVQALEIQREWYLAVTVDPLQGDAVVIASREGGVDIEEVAKSHPEKIQKQYLNGQKTFDLTQGAWLKDLFPDPRAQAIGAKILKDLVDLFYRYDCTLAEINPLVVDRQGSWYAADAKINLDDNALFRHPELQALRDVASEDPDELDAKQNDLSFVKMEGDVGCIVNGAGLAMATLDIIQLLGGNPANFLDVGGSSNPQKVLNALRIILKNQKVKVVLINIFGGITRCDDIAKGILEARRQLDIQVPLVVRLTGTNEKEAKELLAGQGISSVASMREAVVRAVELAREA